jgi:hypothetical protein
MISRLALWMLIVPAIVLTGTSTVHAQTALLDEVHTVSGGATPVEKSFAITQAGTYKLTLTDLKAPAALTSVKLAVTSGATVLGTVSTTPANLSPVLSFDAPVGTVVVRVVGKPATSAGFGSVGVKVMQDTPTGPVSVQEFVARFDAPLTSDPERFVKLDETITLATNGTYEVVLTDIGLPQTLPALTLGITEEGAGQPAVLPAPGSATFTGQAGVRYNILALAEAAAAVNAGLFSVRIREVASGNYVYKRTVAVGRVEQLGTVVLTAAPYVLSLTDFQLPAALAQKGAALTLDGNLAALTTQGGDTPFTASAGEHVLYVLAAAAASNAATYGVEVRPASGAPLFSAVKTVSSASGATPAYSFSTDPVAAGSYHVRLADFAFPATFTTVQLAVAQSGGAILGTLSAAGSVDVTAAAGRLVIVALAKPSTASGGVLGIDVTPAQGGAAVFEVTQGVGSLFQARKVSVPATGTYRVTLQDVGFPTTFTELGSVVTRGAERFGTVLGGAPGAGNAPTSVHFDFAATAGNYFVNFIATPNATENAGTYGIRVADKPPNPTVTLTANPAQVTIGSPVDLTWTSSSATTCVAADGWTGTRELNGTFRTAALNTSATFKLECTGDGGSTSKTVTVNAVAQNSSGGGGGGSIGWLVTLCLALCMALRLAGPAALVRRDRQ